MSAKHPVCLNMLSEKFLGEISTNPKAPITWAERASRFQTSFIAEREQLHKAFMLSQNPGHSSCTNCHEAECSVICMDCKQYKHLCIVSDEMLHSHQPFHDRIGYVNGEMVELKPIQSIDFNGNLIEFGKEIICIYKYYVHHCWNKAPLRCMLIFILAMTVQN